MVQGFTNDEWRGLMSFSTYTNLGVNQDATTMLEIENVSQDEIEGNFEIAFDTGEGDASAKGTFSAAPFPEQGLGILRINRSDL